MISHTVYDELIKNFLDGSISTSEFERSYLDLFIENDENFSTDIYKILENLFFDVDSFTDLPIEKTDNPDDFIDETELRKRASLALEKLRSLK